MTTAHLRGQLQATTKTAPQTGAVGDVLHVAEFWEGDLCMSTSLGVGFCVDVQITGVPCILQTIKSHFVPIYISKYGHEIMEDKKCQN